MTFEEQVLQVELLGYTVLPALLTHAECDEARRELERIFREERDRPGVPAGPFGQQAYNLMNKARVFERTYQLTPLLRLLRHFLGEDAVLSSVQAHLVLPGAPAQRLHADGSLTGPFRPPAPADGDRRITSHVLGFNVVFCLSDFTRENGATRLVPGSHRLPTLRPPEGPLPGETTVEAGRGSVLVFNIACWHGASAHRGSEPRYAVMTPWRRTWLRPEADLSRIVRPDVLERAGPEGPVIFGLTARPPTTDRWQWDAERGRPKPGYGDPALDDT
jgi:ectoine hydroxylase-related dioxygenase (phytanoyl-CoA dioxygenase family)